MLDKKQKKEDILFSILDFLERNGYEKSFQKLKEKVDCQYIEKNKEIVEGLLKENKIIDLIIFIDKNMKISNEEKLYYIKLLKIKYYINLVNKNCSSGNEQKDSLEYLRKEITPVLNQDLRNADLLNSLTYILFIKDKNKLKEYINNNSLNSYEDNTSIISQICKRNIISLETIYDNYIKLNKETISFDNFTSLTINDNCLTPFKSNEIWFIEISKNKNYICVGFSNANISVFNIKKDKNKEIGIYLNLTFSGNESNKKDELTAICFSNDEKYILAALGSFKVVVFDISNGQKIREAKNLHTSGITSIVPMPNSNSKFLTSSIDKRVLMLDISSNDISVVEIGKFCRMKQILFSEACNYIIIISGSKNEISCYNLYTNKIELTIMTNKPIVYGNISKSDKGKYLIYSTSEDQPKINLYNLEKKTIEEKFSGHTQKFMIIKCCFGGDKDQLILSGSEDYTVYVWERGYSILPKYRFRDHFGVVNGAEIWNNDFIISVSDDKSIKVWFTKNKNIKDIKYIKSSKNNFVMKEVDIDTDFFKAMNEPINNENDNDNDNDMQIEYEQNDENEEENMEEIDDEI